tara:strand:- start:26053 stop:30195 length:4143 start_codon:yes stop_codon:yes gene_type:complete
MSVSTVLNRWLKRLYKLLAILLVVFAVLISTLRLFLPYAHNYRQNVEDYINTTYNSNISIGSLSMGWQTSGPTLITRQVELSSLGDNKIYIDSLEVELDFWRSVRSRQLVTKDFVISGAELTFEQDALANSAEEVSDNDESDESLLDSLSTILLDQISRFSIRDSHVLYRSIAGDRAFTINEMFWLNDNDRHQANGTVIVDGLSSNNLKVLLDFKGQSFDNLSGQAYLEANEIDITPWLGRVLAIKDANTHSAINFNAWLNISAGEAEFIQLALGNNKITWQHLDKVQSFEVIGGDVEIKTLGELQFNVATSALTIKRNGIETNRLSLLANVDGDNVNGYISALELASFTGISPLLLNDVALESLLLDLAAVGRVEDIHFRTSADDLAITAEFSNVNSHFSHGIPGIDNVSGELVYLNNQLQISLNAVDGALNFDKHFKYPIPYTRLSSQINAQFFADDWQLLVDNIEFSSPELNLTADVKVESIKDQPITMSLLASVSDGNAKYAEYYYPHLLMGPGLVGYLNGAIVDGKVNQALVLFNGPLQNFPFDHHEGVFVVDAELSESTFKFDPEWPAINNFSANLNFTNNSMLITGRAGQLSGIDVSGVEAAIASLSDGQVLTVDADFTNVQPQQVSQLMDASPMQNSIGVTLEQVLISDPISGDFSLTLPLNDLDAVVAKGHVDFKNNRLALQAPRMDFSQVNGRLDYANDVLTASNVEMDWRGLPLTLNVQAKQKSEFYNVNIETLAQWQASQWHAQLPHDLVKYAQGPLAWQGLLALNISDDKFTYDYQINSKLNELTLALPAPFSKNAAEQVAVSIHAFGDEFNSTISADIGEKVDFYGLLDHQQTHFSLAHLVLGKQQLWLPTTGFHITADLAQANYEQWQPLVLDILASLEAEPVAVNTSAATLASSTSESSLLSTPDKIHGKIDNLSVYGENFQQVDFNFAAEPNWWLLNVNAKELRGSAKFYPDWHQQGIDIDADFMHLNNVDGTSPKEVVSENDPGSEITIAQAKNIASEQAISTTEDDDVEATRHIEKTDADNTELAVDTMIEKPTPLMIDHVSNAEIFAAMPPLKVKCASCRYGDYDFGAVAFTLEREDVNTLLLNKFTAKRGKTQMAFDARWQQDNDSSNTRITGTLNTNSVAREVENIGYASIIRDSGIAMKYDVVWQGGPHDFALSTFDGQLSAKLDDGYLADVDDKGVRILSLLSLQSLVRKLSFDFRDIFSDGMFYSELAGTFTMKNGVVYTDNVLMKGTAGDLTIVGNTNLNNGDLDYRMSYKPNLTSSLPVLAWIATLNPVTFLAGMALDEVITSTVIAEINFEVTGNLDEPTFKQVSRKNKNISVGRSSPPKIVDSTPDNSPDTTAPVPEGPIKPAPIIDNFDG